MVKYVKLYYTFIPFLLNKYDNLTFIIVLQGIIWIKRDVVKIEPKMKTYSDNIQAHSDEEKPRR